MMYCAFGDVGKIKKLQSLHGFLLELKHSLARDAYTTDNLVLTGARQGFPKKQ